MTLLPLANTTLLLPCYYDVTTPLIYYGVTTIYYDVATPLIYYDFTTIYYDVTTPLLIRRHYSLATMTSLLP